MKPAKKEGNYNRPSFFSQELPGDEIRRPCPLPDPAFPFAVTARKDPRELEEPPVLPAYAYKIPDQNSHRRYAPPMMTIKISAINTTHQNHFISFSPSRREAIGVGQY